MGLGAEIAAAEQAAAAELPRRPGRGRAPRRRARFAAAHPEIAAIRVVEFEGILLAASTAPADRGTKAAPRRLAREEKPLYDLGQTLRAAVEGNRQGAEGAARAPETRPRAGRRTACSSLAAPVERGGEVVGMVQMETRAQAGAGRLLLAPLPRRLARAGGRASSCSRSSSASAAGCSPPRPCCWSSTSGPTAATPLGMLKSRSPGRRPSAVAAQIGRGVEAGRGAPRATSGARRRSRSPRRSGTSTSSASRAG